MRLIGLAVILAVSLALAPLAAEGQEPAKVARIGYLAAAMAANPHFPEAFRQGLRDLGYVESRNIVIEYRSAEGQLERLPDLAAELVGSGIIASLARPGGDVTGLSFLGPELVGKHLQLLKQAVPGVTRVAVLWHPGALGERTQRDMLKETEVAARAL